MKILTLIRHAKSSWKHEELDDHERPLNKRGERDALAIARYLQMQSDIDDSFDVIYSSTATRALELGQTISDFTNITLIPDLSFYTFDPDELLEILRSLLEQASRIAIVGHNPAIIQLVNRLSAASLKKLPTSGVVTLECPVDYWHELDQGLCNLNSVITPKLLNG